MRAMIDSQSFFAMLGADEPRTKSPADGALNLAIRMCLGYTKQHEESLEASARRRARPSPSGDLCPRLLEGAGEGRLLDPGPIETPERVCGREQFRGRAGICGRGDCEADRSRRVRRDGLLPQGASVG